MITVVIVVLFILVAWGLWLQFEQWFGPKL